MPQVQFALPRGRSITVEVPSGVSLLDAARRADVAIEGACGGSMACATCHVHVAPAWLDRLPPPSAEEEEMLELAENLHATSRLSCQIRVSEVLDGLRVVVPVSSLLVD